MIPFPAFQLYLFGNSEPTKVKCPFPGGKRDHQFRCREKLIFLKIRSWKYFVLVGSCFVVSWSIQNQWETQSDVIFDLVVQPESSAKLLYRNYDQSVEKDEDYLSVKCQIFIRSGSWDIQVCNLKNLLFPVKKQPPFMDESGSGKSSWKHSFCPWIPQLDDKWRTKMLVGVPAGDLADILLSTGPDMHLWLCGQKVFSLGYQLTLSRLPDSQNFM